MPSRNSFIFTICSAPFLESDCATCKINEIVPRRRIHQGYAVFSEKLSQLWRFHYEEFQLELVSKWTSI